MGDVNVTDQTVRTMNDECWSCRHKRFVPGTHHIRCANPDPAMVGDEHGIREGWFMYPALFDPVWKARWCAHYSGARPRPPETPEEQMDLPEARRRRDEALVTVQQSDIRVAWIERARRIALQLATVRGQVTSDDVIVQMGGYPEGADPRIMGAVFDSRRKDWPLQRIGWTQSKRKQGHGRPMAVSAFKQEERG
jgi:hypothetical protein